MPPFLIVQIVVNRVLIAVFIERINIFVYAPIFSP